MVHNFFLTVNARVVAEFWVGAEAEQLILLCPGAQVAALRENVDRYHFGEDLEISEPGGSLYLVKTKEVGCPDPRYPDQLNFHFVAQEALSDFEAGLSSEHQLQGQDLEMIRLSAGWAQFGTDYDENTLFLEMAQEEDFSESKGCYPGQEIVARVLHRGRLNRSLRRFESAVPIPSDWVARVENKEVARVTTSLPTEGGSHGFLYVRREHGEDDHELTGSGSDGVELALTIKPRAGELRRESE